MAADSLVWRRFARRCADFSAPPLDLLGSTRAFPCAAVDEFGAGGLQRALHLIDRARGHFLKPVRRLQSADSDDGNMGATRRFVLFQA